MAGEVTSAMMLARIQGVGAAAYASRPAFAGYHWEFVTLNGVLVTLLGVPVVMQVRNGTND